MPAPTGKSQSFVLWFLHHLHCGALRAGPQAIPIALPEESLNVRQGIVLANILP